MDSFHDEMEHLADELAFYSVKSLARQVMWPYCACFNEATSEWQRVEVVDWLKNEGEEVIVRLVDVGGEKRCSVTQLREVPARLATRGLFTFPCQLEGVCPGAAEQWSPDALAMFRELLRPDEHLAFTVTYSERRGHMYSVDLCREGVSSVMALLLLRGVASPVYPDCGLPAVESGGGTAIVEQVLGSQRDDDEDGDDAAANVERMLADPGRAMYEHVPVDERRVCKFVNAVGGCKRLPACRWSHEPLDPDGWTADRVEVAWQLGERQLPPSGVTCRLKVTCVRDLRTVYAHPVSWPDMCVESGAEELRDLGRWLGAQEAAGRLRRPAQLPAFGQLVAAVIGDSVERATVVELGAGSCAGDERAQLRLHLEDTGEEVMVTMGKVRELPAKATRLPRQAVRCVLSCSASASTTPPGSPPSPTQLEAGLNYLEEAVLGRTLEADVVVQYDGELQVVLRDIAGRDVGRALVEEGLLLPATDTSLQVCRPVRLPAPIID